MLHEAIVGAFRASGSSFEAWCKEQNRRPQSVRNASFGVIRGQIGTALLTQLIEDAGPDVVKAGYLARLKSHVAEMKGVA
ncbi:MAG: hypothetical protein Q4G22_04635 [Paracoccus sp. (in: a-proteobacteria)]|uniref:hypothetical protein n=1 Tax=Paracoccus sp. TaxID=267 RepID=UPI0026DEC67D|nr:hypothetical protein [Paracoccus sp. (in: a-proteobacteria)]MDO5631105.1 hypothetical protein [Paracoccus sp. (in: a-proteobacteria)]